MTSVTDNSFQASKLKARKVSRPVKKAATSQPDSQFEHLFRTTNLTDWRADQAEIRLLPVSCLHAYREVVLSGNPTQLLPTQNPNNTANASGLVARSGSLHTGHPTSRLARRVNKLQKEMSAAHKPVRYKLYMAAGFVKHVANGRVRRSPIVLIPVTVSKLRGRGSAHTLSYKQGEALRLNPYIADLCNTDVDHLIKPFTAAKELSNYLKSIKNKLHDQLDCRVTANTGILSLQAEVLEDLTPAEVFDLKLEKTKPGAGFKPLPATPPDFDPQLALRLLRFVEPDNLQSALHAISGSDQKKAKHVEDALPNIDSHKRDKLVKCAGWLVDIGLGHWKLKNIARLPLRIDGLVAAIEKTNSNPIYRMYMRQEFRTVNALMRLNSAKNRILNAPPEVKHHATSQHTDTNAPMLLHKAKIQASSLDSELNTIADAFHISAIPDSEALITLIDTIAKREKESQLNNPSYFRARRQLNELLKFHNGLITDNDLDRLERLQRTLEFAETFEHDAVYKRCLGALFNGKDTNWQRLDSVVQYIQSLSQALGSSILVAQLADQWQSFQRDFRTIAPAVEHAASSAYKLRQLIPTFINSDTRLDHAVSTATKLRMRVDQWQKYLHQNFADPELTPLEMLSDFELGDHSYPAVSLSEQEFDERIYRHIINNDVDKISVSQTTNWLLNAIDTLQIDVPSIRRFLDREAELDKKLSHA